MIRGIILYMWASSRKVIYALLLLLSLVILGIYGFRSTLFPTPNCNDNKQNGYEEGVDCGGLCSRKCIAQIIPIEVVWSRVLPVEEGVYDLVGMVSNRNADSAPATFGATFTVYNKNAQVIFSNKISAVPPTTGDLPIMIQNVKLAEKPMKLVITLDEGTYYKTPLAFQTIQISVINTSFEQTDIGRAYAIIRNMTRSRFINFPVRIILYDSEQNAIGVGQTFVESLDKEADKNLIFTWKNHFPSKPVLIKAYPILSPF